MFGFRLHTKVSSTTGLNLESMTLPTAHALYAYTSTTESIRPEQVCSRRTQMHESSAGATLDYSRSPHSLVRSQNQTASGKRRENLNVRIARLQSTKYLNEKQEACSKSAPSTHTHTQSVLPASILRRSPGARTWRLLEPELEEHAQRKWRQQDVQADRNTCL